MKKRDSQRCRDIPEYAVWATMKARCNNPKHNAYPDYGARGITVCERWLKFSNFIEDMGNRPSPKHTIDRIKNSGNYEPGNCRWATRLEQNNNRCNSIIVSFRGQTMFLKEAVELSGNEYNRVHHRISSGWDVISAIEAPAGTRLKDWRVT